MGPTLLGDGWHALLQDYDWSGSYCGSSAAGVTGGNATGYISTSTQTEFCRGYLYQCLTLPPFDAALNQAELTFKYGLHVTFPDDEIGALVISSTCDTDSSGPTASGWSPFGPAGDWLYEYEFTAATWSIDRPVTTLDVTNALANMGGQQIAIGFYFEDGVSGSSMFPGNGLYVDDVRLQVTGEGCSELPLCSETAEARCHTP